VSTPSASVRVLLLADSHLGYDLPAHPRVKRRRRGHDFQASYERALAPASAGAVDMVVHGGDLFHRSKVPPSLVFQGFHPLLAIAEAGMPVFVVPGNHERSRIPHERFSKHPNLHVFHRPRTKVVEVGSLRVAVSGFPYQRHRIRERFPIVLEETGWRGEDAHLRLLCMHQCVEGATVGPADYTFRRAPDVVRGSDLPTDFAAVLSGHIHRHQILQRDLRGRPLPTPVLYPGSVERTAFAEMGEEKGVVLAELRVGGEGASLVRHDFVHIPTRPMMVRDLHPPSTTGGAWLRDDLEARLEVVLKEVPIDAVLRIRVHGRVSREALSAVAAPRLRRLSPPEMNVQVLITERGEDRGSGRSEEDVGASLPLFPGEA
jgi:exonuclease SbcD